MKKAVIIMIHILIVLTFGGSSCSNDQVPHKYKQAVIRLKSDLEQLDTIALEKREVTSNKDSNVYSGIIDFKKQAEYITKNRRLWDENFVMFNDALKSNKLGRWKDDALFCKALALLKMATLENSDVYTESAISSMTDFIEYNQNSKIEKWTKRELKTVFWDKTAILFSNSLTEKDNLNTFFHLGIASLLEHKKGDKRRAWEEYEEVLRIAPNSFFGQQARGQIDLLKGKGRGLDIKF